MTHFYLWNFVVILQKSLPIYVIKSVKYLYIQLLYFKKESLQLCWLHILLKIQFGDLYNIKNYCGS